MIDSTHPVRFVELWAGADPAHRRRPVRWWIALAVLMLAPAISVHGQDTTTPRSVAPAGGSAAVAEDAPSKPMSTIATNPSSAVSEHPIKSGWMERVDAFFGKFLVKPLAAIVFFDFGTGRWLGTSVPFVVVWLLGAGIFLTLRMAFINIRGFKHAIDLTRGIYDDPNETGDVSHFQALSAALSATVGLGNIGGVAVAIATGGPGATFWMVVAGFLGMTTKFAECTLGQMYRTQDSEGHVLGGPMRYLHVGLEEIGWGRVGAALAMIYAVICIGASFGGGNSYQVAQSLSAIQQDIRFLHPDDGFPWIYGAVMALLVGLVIVGGIKSIGRVAGAIVPVMCIAYIATCMFILVTHADRLPTAFAEIFRGAFTPEGMYGGFLGVMVTGIRRAVFSNEAGVGSASIAHSAAKTEQPVSEGIVALLEPFIDTVCVCTATALVVVVTGVYRADRVADRPELQRQVAELVKVDQSTRPVTVQRDGQAVTEQQVVQTARAERGAAITLLAFRSGGYQWFGYVLFFCVFLFAYSTCISWSYYGERCWAELFGERTSFIYKWLFLLFTFLGAVVTPQNILDFSDLMILSLSLPNLFGVFLMSGKIQRALTDYWRLYQSGGLKRHQ
jgi:AGCS family alanine or glycine:cation symporter